VFFEILTVPFLTEFSNGPEFFPAYLGVAISVVGVHYFLHLRPLSGFFHRRGREDLQVSVSEFSQVQKSIPWFSVKNSEVIIAHSFEVS